MRMNPFSPHGSPHCASRRRQQFMKHSMQTSRPKRHASRLDVDSVGTSWAHIDSIRQGSSSQQWWTWAVHSRAAPHGSCAQPKDHVRNLICHSWSQAAPPKSCYRTHAPCYPCHMQTMQTNKRRARQVWLTELRMIQYSTPSSTPQPTTEMTWLDTGSGAYCAYTPPERYSSTSRQYITANEHGSACGTQHVR